MPVTWVLIIAAMDIFELNYQKLRIIELHLSIQKFTLFNSLSAENSKKQFANFKYINRPVCYKNCVQNILANYKILLERKYR
ncbi:hypothetical protein CVD28_19045 [Bacillus sp. M6-12]|nr:hypothetical protein CVD28_19045 [Bacillus sp. M6-12]